MLFGGFRESKPDKGPWVVSLPEDHAVSMYVVLNIIHAKFSFVPRSPSMSFIYEIRALVDKYDMAQSLTPWYEDWAKVLKAQNIEDGPGLITATTLAWDFGDREYFTSLVNRLVLESDINDEGYLRIKDDTCVFESPSPFGPPDLSDTISDIRSGLVQSILDSEHNVVERLLGRQKDDSGKHLDCNYNAKQCNMLMLGSIWLGMEAIRGSFLPRLADEITESVEDLVESIEKVNTWMTIAPEHKYCNRSRDVRDKIKEHLGRCKFELQPSHFELMGKQRGAGEPGEQNGESSKAR
ncbi:hypothetical protein QQX98_012239 [Neonectria punicea]|uniref:Uncharacterized protein n=1 Tax=Neonectria punicea TaxID=979145 RepID=A0ABR1GJD4_9HYPO